MSICNLSKELDLTGFLLDSLGNCGFHLAQIARPLMADSSSSTECGSFFNSNKAEYVDETQMAQRTVQVFQRPERC